MNSYLEGFEGGELDFTLDAIALSNAGSCCCGCCCSGGSEIIIDGSLLGAAMQVRWGHRRRWIRMQRSGRGGIEIDRIQWRGNGMCC